MSTIVIHGGEGGGQILRSALTLSLLMQVPFRIEGIRSKRQKPGLLRQHLTAVHAAAQVGDAEVSGDGLGSQTLSFRPRALRGGDLTLSIGSAGSTTLVLQTLLPALLRAREPSTVTITGGTHNPSAPPVPFLQKTFLPLVKRLGADVALRLDQIGFFPAGGGRIVARITPPETLSPLSCGVRGPLTHRAVRVLLADVPYQVGEREVKEVCHLLDWPVEVAVIETIRRSASPGNTVFVEAGDDEVVEVFTGFGRRGIRAEDVAADAAREAQAYLDGGAQVGPYLADQLIPLLAAGPGGSFVTTELTPHATSQIALLAQMGARPVTTVPEGTMVRVFC